MTNRRGIEQWARLLRDILFVVVSALAVLVFCIWALRHVAGVALVFLLALFFETLLSPFVEWLNERGWPRAWAVFVVMLLAIAVFGVGGGFVVSILAAQIVHLMQHLPQNFNQLVASLPGLFTWLNRMGVRINLAGIENRLLAQAGQISTFIFSKTFGILTSLVAFVADAIVVLFITVYLLVDADRIRQAVFRLVPNPQREGALAVQHTLSRVVGGYVRAQVLLSVLVGGGFGIGVWVIGLPYPLIIAVVAAFFELIPMLGPVLGAILPLLLAFFSPHPVIAVPEVGVLLIAIHLLESQVLVPRLMRAQVGLHPILSVIALMVGADIGGIWGAVFAVPVAGVLVAAWAGAARLWREKVVLPKNRGLRPPS